MLWLSTRRALMLALGGLSASAAHDPGFRDPGAWLRLRAASPARFRWVAFYGEAADENLLADYDLVVLDRMFRGDKARITRRGARLAGYLSLGEISTGDGFFPHLAPAAILDANPWWPSARRVDVRHPSWRSMVLDRMIPAIIAEGFTGLLLDTLDTPVHLEHQDPAGARGMRQAAVALVRAIREAHPGLTLIMNRGYGLLPSVASSLDALLAESLITTGDTGGYKWNDQDGIAHHLALLAGAARRRPPLPVLSLDYWMPDDVAGIRQIYRRERELGHLPYVATRTLQHIVREP